MTALATTCQHGHVAAARWLLALNADLSLRDAAHQTPLHHAVQTGNYELCQALVSRGADLSARDCQHLR
jgi:ankyrin repeat protein